MNHCREFFLNLVHRVDVVDEDQLLRIRRSANQRGRRATVVSRHFVSAQCDQNQTYDLQRAPRSRNTRTRAGPAIVDEERERSACEKSSEVRRVADISASYKTDEQVYENDRQQARAKHALETF